MVLFDPPLSDFIGMKHKESLLFINMGLAADLSRKAACEGALRIMF